MNQQELIQLAQLISTGVVPATEKEKAELDKIYQEGCTPEGLKKAQKIEDKYETFIYDI